MQSVCVIGAGPSGLATLHAFTRKAGTSAPGGDDPVSAKLGVNLVCFEKQKDLGGLWRYDWRTGTDSIGEPVHNSMYRNLWTNSPKECIEMADYTYDEHFDTPVPSFAPRPVILRYVSARAERSDVRRYIRFSTVVQWVEWRGDISKFAVTVCDFAPDQNRSVADGNGSSHGEKAMISSDVPDLFSGTRTYTSLFDRVIVCSGHFSVPQMPEIEGLSKFRGHVVHSHDLRDARDYAGKTVLCIGACVSGEDVACQLIKYGGKRAILSWRTFEPGYDWPDGIEHQPLVRRISADGNVEFINGETRQVDAVILCTGYHYSFPFLHATLRLHARNSFVTERLYRGVIWPTRRELYYVGMQNQWFSFSMFDVQAAHVRDLILSRNDELENVSEEEMERDTAAWLTRYAGCTELRHTVEIQADYIKDILGRVHDYPMTADMVDGKTAHFLRLIELKLAKPHGIMTFRDHRYESVVTGTMAARKKLAWLACLEDDEEAFDDMILK